MTTTDPLTRQPVTRRLRNKGRQSRQVLTVNGRVKLVRRWWHAPSLGSVAPVDAAIDPRLASVSEGVCEMACRLNNDSASFRRTAENLTRTALVSMSGEQLRQVVLVEGREVLAAQQADAIPTSFRATDCVVDPTRPAVQQTTRVYTGPDGVMVPLVTEAEKVKRRQRVRQKRQRSGKRCRPLPPRRKGADQSFKEFKTITFDDERGIAGTKCSPASPGGRSARWSGVKRSGWGSAMPTRRSPTSTGPTGSGPN